MGGNAIAKGESKEREEVKVLRGRDDEYGGVMVEMKEVMDPATFLTSLASSISHWKLQGKKGVWIKLPLERVNLVEVAVKEGFWYHHAEPNYLMLVYWIPQSSLPSTLPANATHRVGIGAFLINPNQEVLVVQEKGGQYQGTGVWKLPTGVVDEGEDISVAAVREVKEETGKQDQEIEAAKWMPFEEYAAQPFIQKYELLRYIHDICKAKVDGKYNGFSPVPSRSFSVQRSYLYLNSSKAPKRDSKL